MIANQLGGRGSTTSSAVASSPTAIVDELMEALSLVTTTAATTVAALPTAVAAATISATASNIRPCLHGSTSHHFSDGRAYRDIIKEYLTVEDECWGKFHDDHEEYFMDLNFAQYIVAFCTSLYLKTNTATLAMKSVLAISLRIKYVFVQANPDWAKFERYYRARNYEH